jgi:hypothetical protein
MSNARLRAFSRFVHDESWPEFPNSHSLQQYLSDYPDAYLLHFDDVTGTGPRANGIDENNQAKASFAYAYLGNLFIHPPG